MSTERRDVEDASTLIGLVLAMRVHWKTAELRLSLQVLLPVSFFLLSLRFSFVLVVLCFHRWNHSLTRPEWRAQVGVDVRLPLLSGSYVLYYSITGCKEGTFDTYTAATWTDLQYLRCPQGHQSYRQRTWRPLCRLHGSLTGFEDLPSRTLLAECRQRGAS